MIIKVNPHYLEIKKNPINEKEINVTKCSFEFSEEITDEYVKEAYFTKDNTSYKVIIVNNECDIPSEVLTEKGQIELGVVCYLVENEEEIKRYNPSPVYFDTLKGSIKANAENTESITPSEMEQYEQALNNGLNELDTALDDLQDKVDSGYFKGDKGDRGERGPKGDTGERGLQGERGLTGETGPQGERGLTGETGPAGRDGVDGQDGRDGVIQYTAGENITIENNVISAIGGGSTTVVGDYTDFNTESKALNIDDLEPGAYLISIKDAANIGNTSIYLSYTYQGAKQTVRTAIPASITSFAPALGFFVITIQQKKQEDNFMLGTMYYFGTILGTKKLCFLNIYLRIRNNEFTLSTGFDYYEVVAITGNQTLLGVKTFNSLPICNGTPTSDNQLVNKKYVDDAIAQAISNL